MIDCAIADAKPQFCLEACECLKRHVDALAAPGGGTNQFRPATVGIRHNLDKTKVLESLHQFVDRLTAYSEPASQIGLAGAPDREIGEQQQAAASSPLTGFLRANE